MNVRTPFTTAMIAYGLMIVFTFAQANQTPKTLFEVALDIDRDGKMDRALLVEGSEPGSLDLYLYLAAGDEKPDLSKTPDLLSKDIAGGFGGLEAKDNGSLLVTYGCGGCSNSNDFTLTIVYRNSEYLIAGFTLDWDTRQGAGSCDINYLTGKGVVSEGIDETNPKPLKGKFTPIKLADWTHEMGSEACDM